LKTGHAAILDRGVFSFGCFVLGGGAVKQPGTVVRMQERAKGFEPSTFSLEG
jgi:hypothetical protein